ncbi:MAG: YfcE family phosphodiesterase [bacterium]|nr:MAG: YfcE family phosphodiesterase [bacterium]
MKLAVMSDTHDHLENLERALKKINRQKPDALVHCGDLCSPFVVDRLAGFRGAVHVVFGNNEGDRFTIDRAARRFEHIAIHGEFGFIETGEGVAAFTHRPEFAEGFATTGRYKAVFYGHTHRHKAERIGDTWLINPGELLGFIERPRYIIFDLAQGTFRSIDI